MENGKIKFDCIFISGESPAKIEELNEWRDKLYSLKLIGEYETGIGYGNLSVRNDYGFVITGSGTGGIEKLIGKHYSKVVGWDIPSNKLACIGKIKASSESLTHAALYDISRGINAVIHIHNLKLWKRLLNGIPTTSKNVEYGTPGMAQEIHRLFRETNVKKRKILVMAGHEEGIISFGRNLDEAGKILLEYYDKYK